MHEAPAAPSSNGNVTEHASTLGSEGWPAQLIGVSLLAALPSLAIEGSDDDG
jgi:hypothetical protein